MRTTSERGVALIVALFLMLAVSIVGASLMFLSQTETYATMNYRMMSQTRYAAEAAIQKAADFLTDSSQYTIPSASGSDPLSNYVTTGYPVKYSGNDVVLSAYSDVSGNYPIGSVQAAFNTAGQGTLTAGNTTIEYYSYAKLISMQQFTSYGGTPDVVQTWEVTGIGRISGSREATVEVTALIERPKVAANTYGAFAMSNECGAMHFHGNTTVDSYDSSAGDYSSTKEETGGDVGTNGNLEIEGSVDVQGNLYSPRTGVGDCTDGAVVALTESGNATVEGGSPIKLPTAVAYPQPVFSVTPPTTEVTLDSTALLATNQASTCLSLGLVLGVNCRISGSTLLINGGGTDVTLPSVILDGITLQIQAYSPAQNVNINSLTGDGNFEVTGSAGNESVVLKLQGLDGDGNELATPLDFSSISWKQNRPEPYDASALQIVYGGSQTLEMEGGNSQSAAVIYAPNAAFDLIGTQDFYGSVLAKTIDSAGTADIHYDRALSGEFWVTGQPMLGTFTWQRY
jgi:hypothetical protein